MKVLKFKNSSFNVSGIVFTYSVLFMYSVCQALATCDIRSCCRRSLHAFTFRYDSTLLGCAIFYTEGFCMRYHHFCKGSCINVTCKS